MWIWGQHTLASNKLGGIPSHTSALPQEADAGRGEVLEANQWETIAFRTWS